MLQIIGFLGCLYLFVKGWEIIANKSYRAEDGTLNGAALAASMFAFAGCAVFVIWLLAQGGAFASSKQADVLDQNLVTADMNDTVMDLNATDMNATVPTTTTPLDRTPSAAVSADDSEATADMNATDMNDTVRNN